jgi:uncharacterized protein YndB with AHSA1/START domain
VAEYRFLTTWLLDGPVEPVFDAINDTATWPQWWRGVRRAELLEEGNADGVGRLWDFTWRSRLPYDLSFRLRVTAVERPWRMDGQADGELVGTGRWRLYHGSAGTAVVYEWNVRTAREWMNRLAPLARPAFAWNHDVVMRQGGEGLARRLGVPLLARS